MWFNKRKISILSQAIKEKNIIRFSYQGQKFVVEPHKLAVMKNSNKKILIAWLIDGRKSGLKSVNIRWCVYRLGKIKEIEISEEHFKHDRPLSDNDRLNINNIISETVEN
jgi:hypothetical protein